MLTREAQKAHYGADGPGVPTYMAPEVIRHYANYTGASDMWSLGCVIAFVMNKGSSHAFYSKYDVFFHKTGMDLFHGRELAKCFSTDLQELVNSLLQVFPFEENFFCLTHSIS